MKTKVNEFLFSVKNMKPVFENPQAFGSFLVMYEGYDCIMSCEISDPQKAEKIRSRKQNSYYWGVLLKTIAKETDHPARELHEAFKWQFLHDISELKHGDKTTIIDRVLSSTEISTKEFEDYQREIRVWASTELGIFVPLPNEII